MAVVSLYNDFDDFSRHSHFSPNTKEEVFQNSRPFILYKPKDKNYQSRNS